MFKCTLTMLCAGEHILIHLYSTFSHTIKTNYRLPLFIIPLERCQIEYELTFKSILYFWQKSVIKLRFIEMEKGGNKLKIDADSILRTLNA